MTTIRIRFCSVNDTGSGLIRFFTWSDFSHVEFALPDGTFLGSRLEDGVQIRPANYCNPDKVEFGCIDVPDAIAKRVMDFAYKQVGKPYDFLAIIGLPLRHDWKRDDAWFCSELVAEAFNEAGYSLVVREPSSRVTPGDVYRSPLVRICSKNS